MSLHDFTAVLEDSQALLEIADRAGITAAQVRLVAAALGNLPAPQMVRLCATAQRRRVEQANKMIRKSEPFDGRGR